MLGIRIRIVISSVLHSDTLELSRERYTND